MRFICVAGYHNDLLKYIFFRFTFPPSISAQDTMLLNKVYYSHKLFGGSMIAASGLSIILPTLTVTLSAAKSLGSPNIPDPSRCSG